MKLPFLTLGLICLASCAGKPTTAPATQEADSETIALQATETESVPPAAPELVTPDLTLADVKGPVATVYITDADGNRYDTYQFDAEGNIVKHAFTSDDFKRVKRDDQGQITGWGYDEYTVEWKDGKPVKFGTRESDGGTSTSTYEYNAEGQRVKSTTLNDFPGDEPFTVILEYSYSPTDVDEHGNWTKRTVKSSDPATTFTEKRVITYQ